MESFSPIFICVMLGVAHSTIITLNKASDISKIIDISCPYSDDYADFWGYGCPTNPENDIYPNSTGFWTSCKQNCEIRYYGGLLPKPSVLWISTYIEGDAFIEISGKDELEDPDFNHFYGFINANSERNEWCYSEFDLTLVSGTTASVLNFTLTSSQNGFVLIDKIMFGLEFSPFPIIPLDTKKDEFVQHWTYDDCSYVDNYQDFWAFGCPAEPLEENPISGAAGYWSPCTERSCRIQYFTSPSVTAASVKIQGYLSESAEIRIEIQDGNRSIAIKANNSQENGGWIDFDQDFTDGFPHKFDITLHQNGGLILLDALYVTSTQSLLDGSNYPLVDLPKCIPTTTEATTTTLFTTTTTPTHTTTDPVTTTPSTPTFSCLDRPDGLYPHFEKCEAFIICFEEELEEFLCPEPLLFDPILLTCKYPEEVLCELSCVNRSDGEYPHPQDCSLFLACRHDLGEVFECPDPLLFDPIDRRCNLPQLVNCNATIIKE